MILSDGDTYLYLTGTEQAYLCWEAIRNWHLKLAIAYHKDGRYAKSAIQILNLRDYNGVIDLMAKKPAKTETRRDNRNADFIGFVNINLTDDEWAIIDKTMEADEIPHMPLHIDYLMDLGKLSLNFSNGGIQVTLTVLEGVSAGYAVSSYSDSLIEALIVTRLKVQNYLEKFPDIYKNGGTRKRRG